MPVAYISLREIGRRLGIPPSTVVYYKDRFEDYIPHIGGKGRRRRYPVDALNIFKEIREMYDNNWSAEQIESELSERYGKGGASSAAQLPSPTQGPAVAQPSKPGSSLPHLEDPNKFVGSLTEIMEKISALMADRREDMEQILALREEKNALLKDKQDREAALEARIKELEDKVNDLLRENTVMEAYIKKRVSGSNPFHSKPSPDFLELPLVIKSVQGEYLGVSGKNKQHLTVRGFISLMQRNAGAAKDIVLEWEKNGDDWRLNVAADDKEKGVKQNLVFDVGDVVTPSNNHVAKLIRMEVDGVEAPDNLLLSLFKQIRDGFDQ